MRKNAAESLIYVIVLWLALNIESCKSRACCVSHKSDVEVLVKLELSTGIPTELVVLSARVKNLRQQLLRRANM
jgi:hypothetical protein